MAACVITDDSADAGEVTALGVVRRQTVCVVHTHYAPCPHNGQPATSTAMHSDGLPNRAEIVRFWWERTHGQRTLVLHHGTFADDHEQSAGCWCKPQVFLATDEPSPMPEV